MDEADDLEGDEREAEAVVGEAAVVERDGTPGEAGPEKRLVPAGFIIIDIEGEPVAGHLGLDFEPLVESGKRGDVKEFGIGGVEAVALEVGAIQEEGLELAEGVVNFHDHGERIPFAVIAEKEADRVEDIAEGPEVGEEGDPSG